MTTLTKSEWFLGGAAILFLSILLLSPTKTSPPSPPPAENLPASTKTEKVPYRIVQDPPRFYPETDLQEKSRTETMPPILEQ